VNDKEEKRGLPIKISDGMLMSFQGDILHHGLQFIKTQLLESYVLQEIFMVFILDYPCQL